MDICCAVDIQSFSRHQGIPCAQSDRIPANANIRCVEFFAYGFGNPFGEFNAKTGWLAVVQIAERDALLAIAGDQNFGFLDAIKVACRRC